MVSRLHLDPMVSKKAGLKSKQPRETKELSAPGSWKVAGAAETAAESKVIKRSPQLLQRPRGRQGAATGAYHVAQQQQMHYFTALVAGKPLKRKEKKR